MHRRETPGIPYLGQFKSETRPTVAQSQSEQPHSTPDVNGYVCGVLLLTDINKERVSAVDDQHVAASVPVRARLGAQS